MAKELIFDLGGKQFPLTPTKFERKKVYGWTELCVETSDGSPCRSVGLDSNGTTVIPKGAIKAAILDEDGLWLDKSDLRATDANGNPVSPVPSSFDAPIALGEKVSEAFFLEHIISSIYVLSGDVAGDLMTAVGNDIYAFPFAYRSSLAPSSGFLFSNGKDLYLFAGEKACFEFVGLKEEAVLDEEDAEGEEESDELDFSMM